MADLKKFVEEIKATNIDELKKEFGELGYVK